MVENLGQNCVQPCIEAQSNTYRHTQQNKYTKLNEKYVPKRPHLYHIKISRTQRPTLLENDKPT